LSIGLRKFRARSLNTLSSINLTNPTLILTAGEPAGIGPDLCVQIAQLDLPCKLVVIADRKLLQDRARIMRFPLKLLDYSPSIGGEQKSGSLQVLHVPLNMPSIPGKLDLANARYVLKTLERAVQGCGNGEFDGMVTAPVHKGIINDAGITFTGHTEYLSQLTNSQVVMMLVGLVRLIEDKVFSERALHFLRPILNVSSITQLL